LNKCFSETGGDGAGLPSTSKRRASVKKRMAGIVAKTRQLAQSLKASLAVRWHIQILSMREEVQSC
jgi:hypothetical protein